MGKEKQSQQVQSTEQPRPFPQSSQVKVAIFLGSCACMFVATKKIADKVFGAALDMIPNRHAGIPAFALGLPTSDGVEADDFDVSLPLPPSQEALDKLSQRQVSEAEQLVASAAKQEAEQATANSVAIASDELSKLTDQVAADWVSAMVNGQAARDNLEVVAKKLDATLEIAEAELREVVAKQLGATLEIADAKMLSHHEEVSDNMREIAKLAISEVGESSAASEWGGGKKANDMQHLMLETISDRSVAPESVTPVKQLGTKQLEDFMESSWFGAPAPPSRPSQPSVPAGAVTAKESTAVRYASSVACMEVATHAVAEERPSAPPRAPVASPLSLLDRVRVNAITELNKVVKAAIRADRAAPKVTSRIPSVQKAVKERSAAWASSKSASIASSVSALLEENKLLAMEEMGSMTKAGGVTGSVNDHAISVWQAALKVERSAKKAVQDAKKESYARTRAKAQADARATMARKLQNLSYDVYTNMSSRVSVVQRGKAEARARATVEVDVEAATHESETKKRYQAAIVILAQAREEVAATRLNVLNTKV
eukprot:gene17235-23559_t